VGQDHNRESSDGRRYQTGLLAICDHPVWIATPMDEDE
jgi:hypothetical protein